MTVMTASNLVQYYEEFRTALFVSGFTLGAFLFSMKGVIMKVMKDDYYDREDYQDSINQRRSLGQKVQFYGNLRHFSRLLLASIYLSFLSAICQISLGYFANIYIVVICMILAVVSWACVGVSIYQVGENWSKALDLSEKRAVDKWRAKNKGPSDPPAG